MQFPLVVKSFLENNGSIDLLVPDEDAVKRAYKTGSIAFPYWSKVWPAAEALTQFLFLNPHYTRDKKVLELGAGLGLPSLVAARNASRVLCTDYVPQAVEIVQASVEQLGLKNVYTKVLDWQKLPPDVSTDVLLLSDINYEPEAFEQLLQLVHVFLTRGSCILLSTPQRLLAKSFIEPLLVYCTRQAEITVMEGEKTVRTTVLVLVKS